jgi:hypothetical protein
LQDEQELDELKQEFEALKNAPTASASEPSDKISPAAPTTL